MITRLAIDRKMLLQNNWKKISELISKTIWCLQIDLLPCANDAVNRSAGPPPQTPAQCNRKRSHVCPTTRTRCWCRRGAYRRGRSCSGSAHGSSGCPAKRTATIKDNRCNYYSRLSRFVLSWIKPAMMNKSHRHRPRTKWCDSGVRVKTSSSTSRLFVRYCIFYKLLFNIYAVGGRRESDK